ncbi:hypothetical protein HU200_042229 [Digitaria exilis]|uniref:Heat shock factor binding protein n=1 Tax=Digitaria exilis TaxID=1010633 RepID=A0A835B696_9POAL|nr:hypothetical protein HU200_042229 [Digitaria exilis]
MYLINMQTNMDSEPSSQNPTDMTAFVSSDSDMHCAKPPGADDEMGTKIDELEQSINDLKAEMGTEAPAQEPEEAKPANSA